MPTSRSLSRRTYSINTPHPPISFFFYLHGAHRDLHSFPTRRSSDLYTVKDCVTIDVLPRTPGNNVYVGFMVWSNFTATKCRGLVSLNQVIKEIICLQPLK